MQSFKRPGKDLLWLLLAIFFTSIAIFSFAQKREKDPVKIRIVKIVDGDTSVIEKSIEESKSGDLAKQFQNINGKNVQVMITLEEDEKGKKKNSSAPSMHLNFDMDSATANAIGKCLIFSDSLMKDFPKDFNFNEDDFMKGFDFDFNIDTKEDGNTVIIKTRGGKTLLINGDEDNVSENKSETDQSKLKTQTKTIVINDENTKTRKKVIVTTSVVVIDMEEEEGNSGKRNTKEESNFSFYPNPSDGNFVLDLELNEKDGAAVRITDMTGKEVYSEKITGNGKVSKTIDLNGKKGTFIVTIKQGKRTNSKKIIIE